MKKFFAILAAASLLFTATPASAQLLGKIFGSSSSSSSTGSDILSGVLNSVAGTVFSAPISLNGTYIYNGLAMSTASGDGNLLSNLAGSAISSGIEGRVNGIIEKIGIKPGAMSFTFDSDETFTCTVMGIPIGGTYKVGESEKTVTLTFGKVMQFFSMTGTLESGLTEAKMLFPANKMTTFFKKIASVVGKSSSSVSALSSITGGSNSTLKLGFKLAKQ